MSELAPRNAQATYQAAFSVVFDLKDAAGPAIGTWLYAMSARCPGAAGIAVALVASFALAVAARRHESEQQSAMKLAAYSAARSSDFTSSSSSLTLEPSSLAMSS